MLSLPSRAESRVGEEYSFYPDLIFEKEYKDAPSAKNLSCPSSRARNLSEKDPIILSSHYQEGDQDFHMRHSGCLGPCFAVPVYQPSPS